MAYRVRARRARAARYVLDLATIEAMDRWTLAEWVGLRDETLRRFRIVLDLVAPFWRFEPGVPEFLRSLPEHPDPRLLTTENVEHRQQFGAELATYDAIVTGRNDWLADHPRWR